MAISDYQSIMLPLLQFAVKRKDEISTREALENLAKSLNLSENNLEEMHPSDARL